MIDYTLPLEQLPDPLPIEPLRKPFDVTITPPGSKSITCRAYVLAALAEGESRIIRPLRAEDTELLLKALCTLGAEARWEGEDVLIKGVAGRFPRGGSVYLGDGGTPTRFMIACACLAAEPVIVDGSPRMRERPIAEGVDMLRQLGAKIEYVETEGRLPVRVVPSDTFRGGDIEITQTQSSQFISATMLLAPWLSSGLILRYPDRVTSGSYVDLTRQVMRAWNAAISSRRLGLLFGPIVTDRFTACPVQGQHFIVESDASSATYWLAAAALAFDSIVMVEGCPGPWHNSAQPDVRFYMAMEDAGAFVDAYPHGVQAVQAMGTLHGRQHDAKGMPDASLALAVLATSAQGTTLITGLRTLRVKETDRLAALANELRKVGCTVETGEDWIEITPASGANDKNPPAEPGANRVVIETYNDHRMAMAFAVLGLVRPGISIRNPACVRKSYPTFWKDFAKLYQ